MTASRIVLKSARSIILEDMLQNLLVSEVMAPSKAVWIVSPWMRNVPVIDNRTGGFNWIDDLWANRVVYLLDWVEVMCNRGASVSLVTTSDEKDQDFLRSARDAQTRVARRSCLRLVEKMSVGQASSGGMHAKFLLTDRWAWQGSMNFTMPGLKTHQEVVQVQFFENDRKAFQEWHQKVKGAWG